MNRNHVVDVCCGFRQLYTTDVLGNGIDQDNQILVLRLPRHETSLRKRDLNGEKHTTFLLE